MNKMNYKFKNKKGFTLLEMLISASIFAIALVIGVDVFFGIARIQKRVVYTQAVQNDARYVMDEMIKHLRSGMIDYDWYEERGISLSDLRDISPAGFNENKILATKDLDNNKFFFARVHEKQKIDGSDRYVMKVCSVDTENDPLDKCDDLIAYTNWQTVTPKDVNVDKFILLVKPEENPFALDESTGDYKANDQPLVTVVYHVSTDRREKAYQVSIKLSATVSSRLYKR